MAMLVFFTGLNTFALRAERRRWLREFAVKHGEQNIMFLDGPRSTLHDLLDAVSAAPFAAEKRLTVVDGTPKITKEDLAVLAEAQHPDCILLIVDPQPDRRTAGAKALLQAAKIQEFPQLRGQQLRAWMHREAGLHGASLEDRAAEALIRVVGEDQEMLAQELAKAAASSAGKPIDEATVSRVAVPSGEQEVWHLGALLSRRDAPAALEYARGLLQRGEDPHALWNLLLWLIRGLGAVTMAVAEGENQPAKIASIAGTPPQTVRTLLPLAQDLGLDAVRDIVAWAADADIALKTGGLRSSSDAPQEVEALIDGLIVRCCSRRRELALRSA